MQNLKKDALDIKKKSLKIIIENQQFNVVEQYLTGEQLKELRGIPLDVNLYLKIKPPYEDELIENDKIVNLARPEVEVFFVKNAYEFTLNGEKFTSFKQILTGEEILKIAGITDVRCVTLYQKLKGCDFEKISLNEKVDLSNSGIENFITKDPEVFSYTINDEPEMTDSKELSPKQILEFAKIDSALYYLVQVLKDGTKKHYAYEPDVLITMSCKGLVFITEEWLDVADVEIFGKECKEIPPAKSFRIKIDKNYYTVTESKISQQQIIQLGGKPNIAKYDIYKFLNGNPKPIRIPENTVVDLTERCLVRFVLQPKEQQDGRGNRVQFSLPQEDVDFLEALNLEWECVLNNGNMMYLLIYDYPIPEGYNTTNATVALAINSSYPITQIDMAYFFPHLNKVNGRTISCVTPLTIDGKNFQQWSRHRQAGEWVPGVDNLSTHLALVDGWLSKDLNR